MTMRFQSFILVAVTVFGACGDTLADDDFIRHENNCCKLVSKSMRENERKILQIRGLNPTELEKIPLPQSWAVDWYKFFPNDRLTVQESKLRLHTSRQLVLYGPYNGVTPSQNYRMDVTLSSPNDAGSAESAIKIGIQEFKSGKIRQCTTVKLLKGETRTFNVIIRLNHFFGRFRPVLTITGDVCLEKYVLSVDAKQIKREGKTLVEGTLTEVSSLPSPQKSAYPDCRFTAHFVGNSILDGIPCPKEVNLVIEGLKAYKLLGASKLKAGDKVYCLMMPFDQLSENEKSTQQADDLNLFSLENYYCIEIRRINDFRDQGLAASGIHFTDKIDYVSVFDHHINPPLSEELVAKQREAIKEELARISQMLDPWDEKQKAKLNHSFLEAWQSEKNKDAKFGPDYNRVKCWGKTFVWRNIDNSFWALPENYNLISPDKRLSKENLECVVAFKNFLEANGCQLIVMLTPNSFDIAARVMNHDYRDIPDFTSAGVIRQLLEAGVETVYASDAIIRNYNKHQFAFCYPPDTHPADTTQDILTDLLAKKLLRYHFTPQLKPEYFKCDWINHAYCKYIQGQFPINCDIGKNTPGTPRLCKNIRYNSKIGKKEAAPVLLISNSYFALPTDQSFAMYLSLKSLINVKRYIFGGGVSPFTVAINHLFQNPTPLKNIKCVVVLMGIDHILLKLPFNNIRDMDQMAKNLVGRKLIYEYTPSDLKTFSGCPLNKQGDAVCEGGQKFSLPVGKERYNASKNCICLVKCSLDAASDIHVFINDKKLTVPVFYNRQYDFSTATIELEANLSEIRLQLSGKKDHKFYIRNIQIFQ